MTTYTEEACPYKDDCPYPEHQHTPNNESELDEILSTLTFHTIGLDPEDTTEEVEKIAKQALLSWRDSAVVEARIHELQGVYSWNAEAKTNIEVAKTVPVFIRIGELTTLKQPKEQP